MYQEGMLGALENVGSDALTVGRAGLAVFVGAAAAKFVTNLLADWASPLTEKGSDGVVKVHSKVAENSVSAMRLYVAPLAPVVLGVGIYNQLGSKFPPEAYGLSAGMVGYSIGTLISNIMLDKEKAKAAVVPVNDAQNKVIGAVLKGDKSGIAAFEMSFNPFISPSRQLAGLGAPDTYDSSLMGLGNMDYSIRRYMMAGAPTQVQRLQGAPVQIQSLNGAPTQVQSLQGAPVQVQSLSPVGLSAAATLL
jgi:hypothetical protein